MSDRSTSLPDWIPGVKKEASRHGEGLHQTSPTGAEESDGKAEPVLPHLGALRRANKRYPSSEGHGPSFPPGMFAFVDHRYIARPGTHAAHSLEAILTAERSQSKSHLVS